MAKFSGIKTRAGRGDFVDYKMFACWPFSIGIFQVTNVIYSETDQFIDKNE